MVLYDSKTQVVTYRGFLRSLVECEEFHWNLGVVWVWLDRSGRTTKSRFTWNADYPPSLAFYAIPPFNLSSASRNLASKNSL